MQCICASKVRDTDQVSGTINEGNAEIIGMHVDTEDIVDGFRIPPCKPAIPAADLEHALPIGGRKLRKPQQVLGLSTFRIAFCDHAALLHAQHFRAADLASAELDQRLVGVLQVVLLHLGLDPCSGRQPQKFPYVTARDVGYRLDLLLHP